MREILFRGKRLDNGEWVYGAVANFRSIANEIYTAIMPKVDGENSMMELKSVDPSTVGQYTGRKDKNGKRIFEGNILNFDGTVFVCYWDDGNLEFGLRNNEESIGMAYMAVYDAEIIGNIHDNPDLLGGGPQ